MGNFTFYAPTRVYFGRKEEERIGSILKQEGCRRVLVHYGGQSAVKSGLLERVLQSLKKAGIPAVTLGGVVPESAAFRARGNRSARTGTGGFHFGSWRRQCDRFCERHRLWRCE
ncbi:MAG: iron-containing alcohol dehydrogenase [[Clostridium] innocuum]